jgi:exosortase/archaeosortase family protein
MRILEKWRQVPQPVRSFLYKGVFLLAVWKVLYLCILLPNRTLDRPLTHLIGAGAVATLNAFTHSSDYSLAKGVDERAVGADGLVYTENVERIYRNREKVLSIADVCNGLEVMVLYVGFIVCWSAGLARKTAFAAGGSVLIVLLNILRCSALTFIYLRWPPYADFYHHYVFTFVIYGLIFWLWYRFIQDGGRLQTQPRMTLQKPALHATTGIE